MNTWVRKTKRRVQCSYCNKWIEVDEYQVVCKWFMKLTSGKVWTKLMHFHARKPYCWIDRAIAEVSRLPVVENRGRKLDNLSDDVRARRQVILRKRGSLVQRIGAEMNGKNRAKRIAQLSSELVSLEVLIEPLGGVPKSWQ